jgi:DNA mismatch repair protein MutS2
MPANESGDWLAPACQEKTRSDLEWDRLLQAIASRCAGSLGERRALSLPFCPSRSAVLVSLGEIREAVALIGADEPLVGGGAPVVTDSLERVRAGGILGPGELRDVARLLASARVLRRFLHARRDRVPRLHGACSTDPRLDDVADEIDRCFDPDGTLSDRASPRLQELRGERQQTRARILHKLDDIMGRYAASLQDSYVTEREGRFVLPVRADSHERFAGIVHGTSATGHTLFMEPRVVIPLGNRLKMIDAEIEREENAVYAMLSARIGEVVDSVAAAEQALAHAELRSACARLAIDLDLSFPVVVDELVLDLVAARHPLLVLDGVAVVPADVRVEQGRGLIISGPNAGGKTVVLKTLGLTALMIRAGLPVPCRETSRVGVFETVFSDMGDEQSISRNLSTFSAHVRNLASIIDGTFAGALVLLDEIATGTDPREGEALAAAVLDGLCARGGAVACTTHYEGLKALALGDDRFTNASVGFDLATMSPTFRLLMGIPGASSALAVARRFGLPSLIIERAEKILGSEERSFEDLVRKLNDERRALELARAATDRERQDLSARRRELEREIERIRQRDKAVLSEETRALVSAVRRAREELRTAEQRLRSRKVDAESVREAARIIDRIASKVAIGGELEPPRDEEAARPMTPVSGHELAPGMKVYVPRVRSQAQIVEVLSGSQVRVAVGSVKLVVPLNELSAAPPASPPPPPRAQASKMVLDAAADPSLPIQTADNRCDLRGLRVDEAVAMTEQFLDRCLNEGRRVAFLIHGHGTGALRNAVREALVSSSYVSRWRPGGQDEGGDGVTVVWLR